jgi:nitroreductase
LLEQRCGLAPTPEPLLPAASFLLGLSSIHWREAWKYGERAFRYCQHDAGHAIAAARYGAAALGWQVHVLTRWSDAAVAEILGLHRAADFGAAELEHPDMMLLVSAGSIPAVATSTEPLLRAAAGGLWSGRANVLSPHHAHDWPIIEEAAAACSKPETQEPPWQAPTLPDSIPSTSQAGAAEIIRQRRSAQEFDGVTSITAAAFYRMLDMTLPRRGVPPWDAIDWAPRVHLAVFVHRVEGLIPGVYLFLRNDAIEARMRAELSDAFEWTRAEASPEHFRLYRVLAADARQAARALSCHQDIAADGAFSLGMLAEYESALARGPWSYRQLFWEAGMLGQVLYLEAEAAGVRGTGIGCFFDDGVHELLGIEGRWLQSLYHFTVGGALADTRLQTLPPYAHLQRA